MQWTRAFSLRTWVLLIVFEVLIVIRTLQKMMVDPELIGCPVRLFAFAILIVLSACPYFIFGIAAFRYSVYDRDPLLQVLKRNHSSKKVADKSSRTIQYQNNQPSKTATQPEDGHANHPHGSNGCESGDFQADRYVL